jgi:hypothetical protein
MFIQNLGKFAIIGDTNYFSQYSLIRQNTADVISSFNVDKAGKLLENPHIAFLFYSCLAEPKFIEGFRQKMDKELEKLYIQEINMIKDACLKTLNQHD